MSLCPGSSGSLRKMRGTLSSSASQVNAQQRLYLHLRVGSPYIRRTLLVALEDEAISRNARGESEGGVLFLVDH